MQLDNQEIEHILLSVLNGAWDQKKSSYFADYRSEILGCIYVSFRYVLNKKVANFHKSVVTTPKVQSSVGQCYTHFSG